MSLVGEIFQEKSKHFLFAPAEIGYRIGLQASALPSEDGIDETGKKWRGTQNPPLATKGSARVSCSRAST